MSVSIDEDDYLSDLALIPDSVSFKTKTPLEDDGEASLDYYSFAQGMDWEDQETKAGKEKKELEDNIPVPKNSGAITQEKKRATEKEKVSGKTPEKTPKPSSNQSASKSLGKKSDHTLVTVQSVIDQLPADQQPPPFDMNHLLASGTRGTDYQLLVLMAKSLRLLCSENTSFAVTMENQGLGNLDDVVFIVRNREKGQEKEPKQKKVQAHQVKYYDHSITVYDFFNQPRTKKKDVENSEQEDDSAENEKMHIGKFFEGWLNCKNNKDFKKIPIENFRSVVFTNAQLDKILLSCIENGKFKKKFIEQHDKVQVFETESTTAFQVNKNFLIKVSKKIKVPASTAVWNAILKAGYIHQIKKIVKKNSKPVIKNGKVKTRKVALVTKEFSETSLKKFKSKLASCMLPEEITAEQIYKILQEKRKKYEKSRVDLFELLYKQALGYLAGRKGHDTTLALQDTERRKLFRQFLESFDFECNQNNIKEMQEEIQANLAKTLNTPSEHVFLCFYHAIREWFTKEYQGKPPVLTKKVLKDLIATAQAQSRTLLVLQGRSDAVLHHIHCDSEGQTVDRVELEELQNALQSDEEGVRVNKLVLVVGEKGIGKSALVKQVCRDLPKASYLVLPALDFVQAGHATHLRSEVTQLQTDVTQVLQKLPSIQTVVIDAAEVWRGSPVKLFEDMITAWSHPERSIVFTVTPEALQSSFFASLKERAEVVSVELLDIEDVEESYPELMQHQNIRELMRFALKPFYLSPFLNFMKKMGPLGFEQALQENSLAMELELTKIWVEGLEPTKKHLRRIAWQKLANSIFKNHRNINKGVEADEQDEGLKELVKDGIVVERDKLYSFNHDLFFENGLLVSWFQRWETAISNDESDSFWKIISEHCKDPRARELFKKWLILHHQQLNQDLIKHTKLIATLPCSEPILSVAIVTKDNVLVKQLLVGMTASEIKGILSKFINFSSHTATSLAIFADNPEALAMFLNVQEALSHPNAKLNFKDGVVKIWAPEDDQPKPQAQKRSIVHSEEQSDSDDEHPRKRQKLDASQDSNSAGEESDSEQEDSSRASRDSEEDNSSCSSEDSSDEEEGYDLAKHDSDSEDSGQEQETDIEAIGNDESEYLILKEFVSNPNKYWQRDLEQEEDSNDELDADDQLDFSPKIFTPKPSSNDEYLYVHYAVKFDRLECLEVLLKKHQGMLNLRTNFGATLLHTSTLCSAHRVTAFLLQNGANIHVTDEFNETPLHNAVYSGNVEGARALLERGADPNATGPFDISPCHIALVTLNADLIKVLMEYGGNFTTMPDGYFPEYGEGGQEFNVADLLQEVWTDKCQFDFSKRPGFDEFIFDFISHLNFGENNPEFIWGRRCSQVDQDIRQKHVELVPHLMKFVEGRAKLSEHGEGFDYWDDESQFNYALHVQNMELLQEVSHYILEDSDRIARVFSIPLFEKFKAELVTGWIMMMSDCDDQEYLTNLTNYAKEEEDEVILKMLKDAYPRLDLSQNTQSKSKSPEKSKKSDHNESENGSEEMEQDSSKNDESHDESAEALVSHANDEPAQERMSDDGESSTQELMSDDCLQAAKPEKTLLHYFKLQNSKGTGINQQATSKASAKPKMEQKKQPK